MMNAEVLSVSIRVGKGNDCLILPGCELFIHGSWQEIHDWALALVHQASVEMEVKP